MAEFKDDKNSSKMWKNVRGWLGWKSTSSPTKLYFDNKIQTSPKQNAKIMNEYYINKIKKIKSDLPPPTVDPLYQLKKMMSGCPFKFEFSPVGPDKVRAIITNLRNSKSCGLDDIDSHALKLAVDYIVPPITHIVNLSLSSSMFPESYKIGKIIPLYKSKGSLLEE